MPFYKKFAEFEFSMKQSNLKQFNSIDNLEVIISVDAPQESELLHDFLTELAQKNLMKFSLKVFVNELDHPWRCPSAAINVGIRHAKYEKILVISPETIPLPNSIPMLANAVGEQAFALGIIKHDTADKIAAIGPEEAFIQKKTPMLPYGSICFTKKQAQAIGGYDESFMEWGGDDDDFRARLMSKGFSRKQTLAKFLHSKFPERTLNRAENTKQLKRQKKVLEKIDLIKNKNQEVANNGQFGLSFDKLLFDFVYHHSESEVV